MGTPTVVGVRAVVVLGGLLELMDMGCCEGGGEAWMHGALLLLVLFTVFRMS